MKLNRSPQGKFIGSSQIIPAWLPAILAGCGWSMPITEMLDTAVEWCRREAGKALVHGGGQLAAGTKNDPAWLPDYHLKRYQKLIDTAALLRDCAAKVREVWR